MKVKEKYLPLQKVSEPSGNLMVMEFKLRILFENQEIIYGLLQKIADQVIPEVVDDFAYLDYPENKGK